MSKPTRWALVYLVFAIAVGGIVAACASGGANGGGDDTGDEPMDAAVNVRMDGDIAIADAPKVKLDGGVPMADAFNPPPDAPPGSLFCTANAQCTVAGECCVTLGGPMGFCAPGTIILGQCVPFN